MNFADSNNKQEVFVFVPSYNHAPFVEKCLKSIIKQTLSPKKLLVIDDGSKDDSPKIIEKVLKNCPFDAELIVRENRGLCATLNQGLALSLGKYFAYLGSDDLWLPEFLAERAKLLDRRETAVLGYGHAFFVNEKDEIINCTADYKEIWANYPDGDARPMLVKGIAPVSSTVFYRRKALENVGWNENSRLEDYEMYVQLAALGDFAFDEQILSVWRHHGYNTSKDLLLMLKEVLEAQRRNFKFLGVSENELNRAQTAVKFYYARDLLQHGNKKQAWKLARENWRGANSNFELAKFLVRLGVPMSVVEAKRKLKKENYSRRFEKPEIE
ncbi:MAG: glycosyltransferase family A protein [Pyrinomonadaceae bacterium]